METIYESAYFKVEFDSSTKLLKTVWNEKSGEMNEKQMREEILKAASLVEEYKPLYILTNDRDRTYVYTVEVQQWVAQTLASAAIKAEIKKFAVLLPTEIIAQMSTEQTADEVHNTPYEVNLFNDEQEALKWLGL